MIAQCAYSPRENRRKENSYMFSAISLPMFDVWNADAFSVASFALRVSTAFRSHASSITITARLWKLDGAIADLLAKIYAGVNSGKKADPPTEESVRAALSALRTICAATDTIYQAAKVSGHTNGWFAGAALNSIKVRSEELLDVVEAVETGMDDPRIDGIFEKSLAELEGGETIKMSDL
jgi:hypothetical protein